MSGSISGTTLAYIGAAAAVAGTATAAVSSSQQASAASAAAKYQSEVAASNQQIAMQNASFASATGEAAAAAQQQKNRAEMGQILAAQGSSGVDINSSTDSSVRKSSSELGALDVQTIRANAARQAYGYETQGTSFGNQSSASTATSKNDKTGGEIGVGNSLLSGTGNASLNYAKAINSGSGINNDASNYINSSTQSQVASDLNAEQ